MTTGIGFVTCADIAERDAIPAYRRRPGLMAHIESTNTTYSLQGGVANSNWVNTGIHTSTSPPGAANDSSQGFSRFSEWCDTSTRKLYFCVDPSVGAARWIELTSNKFIYVFSSSAEPNFIIPVETMAEAMALCVPWGYGEMYVGGSHGSFDVPSDSSVYIYTSNSFYASFGDIQLGTYAGAWWVDLIISGTCSIGRITNEPTCAAASLNLAGNDPRSVRASFIHIESPDSQLFLRNTSVVAFAWPPPPVPPVGTDSVITFRSASGEVVLDNVEVGCYDPAGYVINGIEINNGSAERMILRDVYSSIFSTPNADFDKFNSFLKITGVVEIIDMLTKNAVNGLHIIGSNSKIKITGADLGTNSANDILVDPAAVDVEINAQSLRYDPTKISVPATTTLITSGIRTDGQGHYIGGTSNLTQLLELLTDGVAVGKIDTNGEMSHTPIPANWAGIPPITVQEAIRRISTALAGLVGPIP